MFRILSFLYKCAGLWSPQCIKLNTEIESNYTSYGSVQLEFDLAPVKYNLDRFKLFLVQHRPKSERKSMIIHSSVLIRLVSKVVNVFCIRWYVTCVVNFNKT